MRSDADNEASFSVAIPIRYVLVLWLLVMSTVAYLDRTNISIAGIDIAKEFSISNVRLGWVFSAFLIGYAGFQIPAGILARRLGPRRALGLLGLWWGFFITLTALIPKQTVNALPLLIAIRFALGAGEAMMYPATSQFVERWFPVSERGKANALIFAGVGLGGGLTPGLVRTIIEYHGWRASFAFSACVGLSAGLVWWRLARNTPEQHKWVSARECALIESGRPAPVEQRHGGEAARREIPWAGILRNRGIYALTVSYFSFGYVAWMFFAWIYTYMATVRGLNLKTSALYASLPFIAMTIGCLIGGAVGDRVTARYGLRLGRCVLPGVSLAATSGLLLVGSSAHEVRTAALVLALGAGVLYLAQSAFWAVAADIAGESTGIVGGIMNMGAQIGGASTASITPLIAAHFGWGMSFVVAAVLALIGGAAWMLIDPENRIAAR